MNRSGRRFASEWLTRLKSQAVLRAASLTLGAAAIAQATLVVSGIILARALGAENRGYLALLLLLPIILVAIGELGLPFATAYYVAVHPSSASGIVRVLRIPVLAQLIVILAVQVGVLAWYVADKPPDVKAAALFTLAGPPTSLAIDYGLALLQGQRRFLWFNILRNGPSAINALAVLLLYMAGTRAFGAYCGAWYLSLAVSSAAVLVVARRSVHDAPTGGRTVNLSTLLQFGLKGMVGSLYPVESFRLDQLFVGVVLSPVALGYYVVGLAFTNLPRFIAQSLGMVAYPYIAGIEMRAARRLWMWRFVVWTVVLLVACVSLLELVLDPVVHWLFGPQFAPSIPLGRILLIAALILSARRILSEGLKGAGFPLSGTASEIASWVAILPGLALSASLKWGALGVAWSVTGSGLVSLGVLLLIDRRHAQTAPHREAALEDSSTLRASEGVNRDAINPPPSPGG